MTTEQKLKLKQIFIDAWNNTDVPSKEIHQFITNQAREEGIFQADDADITAEACRKSFSTLGEEYTNYRKRPRKKEEKEESFFDFGEKNKDSVKKENTDPDVEVQDTPDSETDHVSNETLRQEPTKLEW